jgi:hypothetical protein
MGRVFGLSQFGKDLNPQREQDLLSLALFNNVYTVADVLVDEGCFWSRRIKRLIR